MNLLTKVLYINTVLIFLLFIVLLSIPFKKGAYRKDMPTIYHKIICKLLTILLLIELILGSTKLATLIIESP